MRYDILKLLKEAGIGYVTGAEIGKRFGVSRSAIWKHIAELRSEGYSVEASPRKGYRLLPSNECLNAFEISNGLGTQVVGRRVLYFDTLASTNRHAASLAAEGCENGLTVVAGRQTQGRGRLGRSWESPSDKGIYLSVVLRPPMAPAETQIFTLAAATAAVKAINNSAGIRTGIKWPNDIVSCGKKVCGILLEMSSETDRVNYIILGMGINYSQTVEDFPEELRDRAVSIVSAVESEGQNVSSSSGTISELSKTTSSGRLALLRALLRELDGVVHDILNGRHSGILDIWREYSVTLGREIRFTIRDKEYTGTAADIAPDGRLLVDCSDGMRRALVSGEISVRGLYGYV